MTGHDVRRDVGARGSRCTRGRRWVLLAMVVGVALAVAGPATARAAGQGRGDAWTVIVNDANPIVVLTRAQVARLFLKKVTRWSTGALVEPVDLAAESPVRAAFSHAVLGRSVPTVKAYWSARIFSGRDTPPPERATQAEVLAFVRASPAAVGYVDADAPLPPGVHAVTVVP